ncbi:MAG: hypothetical protein EXR29_15435 [Betaproteobacteria bacterium]|nr:hypothetical protein [Betaproteobacteria bacterium]
MQRIVEQQVIERFIACGDPRTPALLPEGEGRFEMQMVRQPSARGLTMDGPGVVRRILEHLGRWVPEPTERGPPAQAPDWPRNAAIPITYRPVADIA